MNTSKFSTRVSFGGCLISGRTVCPCQECNLRISMDYCYFCQVRFPQSWIPRQIFPAENQSTIGAVPSSSWPKIDRLRLWDTTVTLLELSWGQLVGQLVLQKLEFYADPWLKLRPWSISFGRCKRHPPGTKGTREMEIPMEITSFDAFWSMECWVRRSFWRCRPDVCPELHQWNRVALPIHFPNILSSGFYERESSHLPQSCKNYPLHYW